MFPHEHLEAHLRELMGRRLAVLGPWMDTLLGPLIVGLSDQLSIYQDQLGRPARLRLDGLHVRETSTRTHVLVGLRDHYAPLRLRAHVARWDSVPDSSRAEEWVRANLARRWRFIERNHRLLDDLFTQLADQLLTYAAQRPRTRLLGSGGLNRLVEDIDRTWLVIDFEREEDGATTAADLWSDRWRI